MYLSNEGNVDMYIIFLVKLLKSCTVFHYTCRLLSLSVMLLENRERFVWNLSLDSLHMKSHWFNILRVKSHWFNILHVKSHWFNILRVKSHWFNILRVKSHWFNILSVKSHWFNILRVKSHWFNILHMKSHWFKLYVNITGPNIACGMSLVQSS